MHSFQGQRFPLSDTCLNSAGPNSLLWQHSESHHREESHPAFQVQKSETSACLGVSHLFELVSSYFCCVVDPRLLRATMVLLLTSICKNWRTLWFTGTGCGSGEEVARIEWWQPKSCLREWWLGHSFLYDSSALPPTTPSHSWPTHEQLEKCGGMSFLYCHRTQYTAPPP